MKGYIEKAAIIPALEDYYEPINPDFPMTLGLGQILEVLQNMPAADVVEVRHGRWDKNGRCTLCGGHAPFWAMASTYYKSPWCHECGARMDKEGEHEAD